VTISRKGFTLIEIIIFIVVAGIFAPLTYVAFSSALKQGTAPEDWSGARSIAEQAVELAAKRGFTQITTDISGGLPTCASMGVNVTSGFGCNWTAARQTFNGAAFSSSGSGNYILITITVTTPMGNSFSTSTLVTNHAY
jgi:prepilin-type N-terminal cleavage/methylation domain-containing protein